MKIVLFGDSTEGNPALTSDLQSRMDTEFGASQVRVVNRAVEGTRIDDLLAGKDGVNTQPWPEPLDEEKPQIIVVGHAMNSMQGKYPVDDYAAKMQSLLTLSAGKVNRVLFQTPNDITTKPPEGAQWKVDLLPSYLDAMRTVAAKNGVPVIDVYAYTHTVSDWQSYMTDGMHANPDFYAMEVKDLVGPTLASTVRALRCQ
ncbi:MAG TPA: SGNH/GDSL hydrolase family protein [Burkholderiaceae bacterium]|jgi:lysophospholipase L1-like esterase|nr:SGNH/GDSL hydrolase family protein [Burkholderiaceae bacterium]